MVRGLSGASGAAVLVPGGILAALLLLALAGACGRIGGLGQAFSGPAVRGSSPVASAPASPARHRSGLVPVVTARVATGAVAVGSTGAAARGTAGVSPKGLTVRPPSTAGGGRPAGSNLAHLKLP